MSTPNKCPKCGADSVGNHGEGWFSCGSHRSHKEPSPLCRERAAHDETRKREDAIKLQFDQAVAQRDFWEKRCDEIGAELASAEAKLADALADAASWQQQADDRLNDAVEFGRRAEKAEARVKELEAELSQSFELAESQLYAEKLAGNIVKEEFWKGELSALHRIRKAIQGKADK